MEESMTVRLVNYSQNAADDSLLDQIAYAARVSNPDNQNNKETSEKLVRYLIREKHWSPLEMVSVCMEIDTTRDIARQILRHRSFSFQEFSQRYADPTNDLDWYIRQARLQDTKNRQNSIEEGVDDYIVERWTEEQMRVQLETMKAYKWAIDNGIAKEQARAVLPEGNMGSRIYMNGTLRSWVHYIDLRSGNGTQKEHMEIARECADALAPIFPMIKEFVHND
jgi:thymidylate synthase (FAD)